MPTLTITPRLSTERGHANHGWLNTYHTFSFASYHDPAYQSFGPLRVINEDRVARSTGFGEHAHAEYMIWSYIVSGELEHRDSMGNVEVLKRGDVQFTSAGTGIRHSEWNRNAEKDNHFLQIWARPSIKRLPPKYITSTFPDSLKNNRFVRVLESVDRAFDPKAKVFETDPEPIPLHADLSMSAAILSPGKSLSHGLVADGPRKMYVHVVMTSGAEKPKDGGAKIKVGHVVLEEGDGAFVEIGDGGEKSIEFESVGKADAEFVLFDMGP